MKYFSKDDTSGPIMPGIGCFARRLYIENWLALKALHPDEKHFARPLTLESCITCNNRSNCKKVMVTFQ